MTIGQDEINVRVTATTGDVQANMREASAAVRDATAKMNASFASLQQTIDRINIVGITTAIAGAVGLAMKAGIAATVELAKQSEELGQRLGTTATGASVLRNALAGTAVDQQAVETATEKITQKLATNEGAFKALGVATRDSSGHLRNAFDVMIDVNSKLGEFREGSDRGVEAAKIYGESWSQVVPTLRLTREEMEQAKQRAKDLHLEVGEESLAASARYQRAMGGASQVVLALKKSIGDVLLPVLSSVAEWFNSIGPTAVNVLRGALVGVTAAFYAIKVAVESAYNALKAGVQQMVVVLLTLADTAAHALRFDFAGARDAWSRGWTQVRDIGAAALDGIVDDVRDAQSKIADAMSRAFGEETASGRTDGKVGTGTAPKGRAGKGAKYEIPYGEELSARMADQGRAMENAIEKSTTRIKIGLDDAYNKGIIERAMAQIDRQTKTLGLMFKPIGDAFEGMLSGILNGTQTIGQAFSRMGLSIAASFGNAIAQAIVNFAKLQVVALATGNRVKLAQVKNDAAQAASGAYKAVAGIPYVGPFLAPAAAAAAYAGTIAFASAAKGYDIPAGVNPMTQLHAKEMVLPQKYADVIRAQAEGRGGGRSITFAPVVQGAIDGDSVRRLFQSAEFRRECLRFAEGVA